MIKPGQDTWFQIIVSRLSASSASAIMSDVLYHQLCMRSCVV